MKSLRGKIVLAAIILSCGFVMQAEQATEAKRPRSTDLTPQNRNLSYDPLDSAGKPPLVSLPGQRSW